MKPGKKSLQLARSLALTLGLFTLANLAALLFAPTFDANRWWIDLHFMPKPVEYGLLAICAPVLIIFGIGGKRFFWSNHLVAVVAAALGLVALINSVQFYILVMERSIDANFPLPFSLLIAMGFGLIFYFSRRQINFLQEPHPAGIVGGAFLLMMLFPFLQTLCFGKTSYARRADVAVVFGARAYADGRPSDALSDRVRTACELYREGQVKKLLFSGGPGDGSVHETESMRRAALASGVKAEDILLDPDGLNTERTVVNSAMVCRKLGLRRVLAVSHFYHLPRIKMTYQREGIEAYTVPAKESYLLRQTPYSMMREVAAFWVYYFRPLMG